jgi:hypothetical protein
VVPHRLRPEVKQRERLETEIGRKTEADDRHRQFGQNRGFRQDIQNRVFRQDVTKGPVPFSTPQRNMVIQAVDEAEARTGSYYCIPPFRWQQLRYELLMHGDNGWEPLPESVFARVQRVWQPRPASPLDFYRIELNDHSILSAAEREEIEDLYPFLVYILTHEMVHLVRFSSILPEGSYMMPFDVSEESRVQRISSQILARAPEYDRVLRKFCIDPASAGPALALS